MSENKSAEHEYENFSKRGLLEAMRRCNAQRKQLEAKLEEYRRQSPVEESSAPLKDKILEWDYCHSCKMLVVGVPVGADDEYLQTECSECGSITVKIDVSELTHRLQSSAPLQDKSAGVWRNCFGNLPNGFTELIVRTLPDKKKYLVGKASDHLIFNGDIIEGEDLKQWEWLDESQSSAPLKEGESWQEVFKKMRDNNEFDDKYNTHTLAFSYAFQKGFKAALQSSAPLQEQAKEDKEVLYKTLKDLYNICNELFGGENAPDKGEIPELTKAKKVLKELQPVDKKQDKDVQPVDANWSKLAKIAPPEKWIEVYKHYQELLTAANTGAWWQEQFYIADAERNELKDKLSKLEPPKSINNG